MESEFPNDEAQRAFDLLADCMEANNIPVPAGIYAMFVAVLTALQHSKDPEGLRYIKELRICLDIYEANLRKSVIEEITGTKT